MEAWVPELGCLKWTQWLYPGRSRAILWSFPEVGNVSPLWGMLTTGLTVCILWEHQDTATSCQVSLTRISQKADPPLSQLHGKISYNLSYQNAHFLYQTALWRLPTMLPKGTEMSYLICLPNTWEGQIHQAARSAVNSKALLAVMGVYMKKHRPSSDLSESEFI